MPATVKASVLSLSIMFLLAGCSPAESLKRFDQKLGEIFFNAEAADEKPGSEPAGGENTGSIVGYRDLSAEQKEKIDAWLSGQGLNRFGDPLETMYAGGTPLYDESTGKAVERYEYILEKIPDILDKIK